VDENNDAESWAKKQLCGKAKQQQQKK